MAQAATEATRAAAKARDANPTHERAKLARGPLPQTPQEPTPAIDIDVIAAMRDRNGRNGR